MTEKVLKQFFEDFLTDPRFRNVNTLHLYNAGEVLLHPNIDKMLAIIMEYKIKANAMNIRFPEVGLLTNATVLNQSKSEILLSSGVLDHIRFSMDGGNKENFENMRVRADWNSFVQNIRKFCELNRKDERPVRTGIISLLDFKDKLSTEWMSREFVELLEVVDGYELRYAHNWAGEVDLDLSEAPVKKKQFKTGCSLLMHQLVLLPNGDITVCCADLNSKGVVGNILKNSLSEIYKAPERILMLSQFFKGRKSEIELCKGCETF
jgi:radical SAM protein with 4Fe4S-binding SPASM domain